MKHNKVEAIVKIRKRIKPSSMYFNIKKGATDERIVIEITTKITFFV